MVSPLPPDLGVRFRVEEVFADSAFARSFRAHDAVLQRDVLLKMPAREAFEGWTAPVRERLLREARALARIRHPGIAPIHHVEETSEGPLLVLDLPEGESLAERLQHAGPLDVADTIAIASQVADALVHVHEQGVVHRAVGPATIRMLANGRVQLGSFTFAKEFGGGRGTSLVNLRKSAAIASRASHLPEYPAPEQLAGQPADPRADVWALGCTMFRCLAGVDPFPPGTETAGAPDLRALRRDVPRSLAEVVRKCMAFAKSARFATVREVVAALQLVKVAPPVSVHRGRVVGGTIAIASLLAVVWFARGGAADGSLRAAVPPATATVAAVGAFKGEYRKVHGLFIAIGEGYSDPHWGRLRNPVSEARSLMDCLRATNPEWSAENMRLLPDAEATADGIQRELRRLRDVDPEDAVFVWFAGHGTKLPRQFALCASDASGDLATGSGFVHDRELLTFSDECKAKHVLVVLDCCHSGAILESARLVVDGGGRDRGSAPGNASWYRSHGSREFLCSTGADQVAKDGDTMSPFCATFLEQLQKPLLPSQQFVTARHLSSRIEEVMQQRGIEVRAYQTPRYEAAEQQQGSFVFRVVPKAK